MAVSKIHRLLVEHVVAALQAVFSEGRQADKVLEKLFKEDKKLGARDRRFIAENFYDCVRWWRLYLYLLEGEVSDAYLLKSRSKSEVFCVWGVHHLLKQAELPVWFDFQVPSLSELTHRREETKQLAILESIPDWLTEKGREELGERWPEILHSLNSQASVDLRANTLKVSPSDLVKALQKEETEVQKIPNSEVGLSLLERKNVFATEAFQKGFFEVQDRSSQRIAPFLKLASGQRVVDACAGGGGKSLHIASEMKNKGKIISLDIHQWKLDELRARAKRAGVDIIETRLIDSNKVIKRLEKSADRLLLDVPCSGLGVLRRNPDRKWKITVTELAGLQQLQREILENYSEIIKVGGKMVYATCSILPSENEKQIEWFLSKFPDWQLEEQLRLDPDESQGDGFFAARLIRK